MALAGGVGGEHVTGALLDLGQVWLIAINAAAGGIYDALHSGIACTDEDVERAGDVRGMGVTRALDAAGTEPSAA